MTAPAEALVRDELELLSWLPERLFSPVVTCTAGTLEERVRSALAWRQALLAGQLPTANLAWPPEPLRSVAEELLAELTLPHFCTRAEPVADELVAQLMALSDVAAHEDEERPDPAVAIRELWAPRVRDWRRIESVFGELGQLLGWGEDLGRGVLRQAGFLEAERLSALIERVPTVARLVRTLGRMRDGETAATLQALFEGMTRAPEEAREIRTPYVPADANGIERSGSVSRMLPSEASMLGHPVLRKLWHARRAERTLLTYLVEGTGYDSAPPRLPPRLERGPVIVCVDTSASMRGTPERIAKALALEAARTAHRENRRCLLFAFSGPDQVVEHELTFGAGGIPRLLDFLALSFEGGTELSEPLLRASARLESEHWARADLLVLTDGLFLPPPLAIKRLRDALDHRGARAHGVLVGRDRSRVLESFCDPVFAFADWEAVEGL